jgi:hypothetical protein
MHLVAHQNCHGGRTDQSIRFNIPACVPEDSVACRSQRRKVRDGGACDERGGSFRWQPKQLDHPVHRHTLECCRCRCHLVHAHILVPGRRQPVTGDCNRQGTTNHETEIARTGHRHGCWRPDFIELLKYRHIGDTVFGHGLDKSVDSRNRVRRWGDRAGRACYAIIDAALCRRFQ